MFTFKVLILVVTCLSWSSCKHDSYCSICEDHTLCKFSGIGEACVAVGKGGISEDEKKEILDTHNWVRKLVAGGFEHRGTAGPQPKAANMRKLVWDNELQKIAQGWADQCTFQHDTCRNVQRWKVGQNLFWKMKYPNHQVNWTEAIMSWYDEVALYDQKEVNSYKFNPATGHYTQMIWHDTNYIGCGRRDYGNNKLYVCNYGPTGNWIGEPMYTIGEPCSKCPEGTQCDEYICGSSPPSTRKVSSLSPKLNAEGSEENSSPCESSENLIIQRSANAIEDDTNDIIEETRRKLKIITSDLENLVISAINKAKAKI